MKIYTKTGDTGETSLLGGKRVLKSDARVNAYGTVDELNSSIGMAILEVRNATTRILLRSIQQTLFNLGAQLASPEPFESAIPKIRQIDIEILESTIDEISSRLPPLRNFILPGGSRGAAALHMSRTVCRRAERAVVSLAQHEKIDEIDLAYLNRLSDLLFQLARQENAASNTAEVVWKKESKET